jgi:hypothetical protein
MLLALVIGIVWSLSTGVAVYETLARKPIGYREYGSNTNEVLRG